MSILFYGERGLVNSIVLELNNNIELTKKVLGCVKLGSGQVLHWLDRLERVVFWIEPSFGQFGDPDLIAVCHCKDSEQYIVFIEAKTVPYEDSAKSLTDKYFSGINSCINAQLTLKYRFIQALMRKTANHAIIEESPAMANVYKKFSTDNKQSTPRKIAHPYIVSRCREMQRHCQGFYFAALTNDKTDVDMDTIAQDPKMRPAILDEEGNDLWQSQQQNFGILTYARLENVLPPDGIFAATRKVVLPAPFTKSNIISADSRTLKTINWKDFSATTVELRNRLRQIIMEAAIEADGADRKVIKKYEYAGSDSFKEMGGNTIIKIIPYKGESEESILLAVKDSLVTASMSVDYFDQGPFHIGVGTNARDFYGHFINAETSAEELEQCRSYLADILNIC